MEEHIARRTTSAAAKPSSPLSPPHHSRRQSRQSHQSSRDTRDTRKQHPQHHPPSSARSGQRRSEHHNHQSSTNLDKRRTQTQPTQQLTPILTTTERAIGKGASLPVVDEKGQVWFDWEEKQEFAPLITVEHERSGWVNFPGATTGRSGSFSSTTSDDDDDGEGTDEGFPSPIRLPLHAVLDAFTFQPAAATAAAGGGGGGGARTGAIETGTGVVTAAVAAAAADAKDPLLHGLQVPSGARPRGKDRRVVRRADSLPALDQEAKANKDAAAREFLDASFDPVQAMLAIQHQQQQASVVAAAATTDASAAAHNKQLAFGKRASMSMKGLKKMFLRKKSTSA